ncbi:MAG: hypothetical protein NWQ55_12620, partial [Salibacteraceae bacterium]|nr:hypothetical protein [Salibacteraceae bacterium]MDP4965914.1 hypothetical protein [Salibacteraceae bacterium]
MKAVVSPLTIFSLSLLMLNACSSERYATGEVDDIYYSQSDRYQRAGNTEFSTESTPSEEKYTTA